MSRKRSPRPKPKVSSNAINRETRIANDVSEFLHSHPDVPDPDLAGFVIMLQFFEGPEDGSRVFGGTVLSPPKHKAESSSESDRILYGMTAILETLRAIMGGRPEFRALILDYLQRE